MRGVVVDEVERITSPVKDVIVGVVLEVARHPNADKLSLCRVDTGRATYSVVCGAPNVKAGARYPFALVGSVLPDGTKIKRAKIRGEVSEGMLLSEWELGISEDHEGLLELDANAEIGSPIEGILDFEDHVFLVDVTANRMDLLCHLGVAREIAALEGKEVRLPPILLDEDAKGFGQGAAIEVRDVEGCSRYMARVVEGARVGPSPQWLVRRLASVGQRSINNVVDVTNLILFELGTPLHAFDLDRLSGRTIVVRRAMEGERMVTLDGVERELSTEMTMIADREKSVAIGGVMGSLDAEVSQNTVNILIECAHFNPQRMRRTSRALGLETEASTRFERWVDPSILPYAVDRAADLMQKVAGGTVLAGRGDVYPDPPVPCTLRLRRERVRKILGRDVGEEEICRLLESIGFRVEGDGEFQVEVPLFRARDVTREIDLIEEIARLKGYDWIDSQYSHGVRVFGKIDRIGRYEKRLKEFVRSEGFFEVVSTSFVSAGVASSLLLVPERAMAQVKNPVNVEEPYLRPLLLSSLLPVLANNVRKRNRDVRIFEQGTVFRSAERHGEKPGESCHLAVAATGARDPASWRGKRAGWDFYSFKGVVEVLLEKFYPGSRYSAGDHSFLHEKRSSEIVMGSRLLGFFGEVIPEVSGKLDVEDPLFVLEIDAEAGLSFPERRREVSLSRFPPLERDISLVIPENVPYIDVETAIRRRAGGLLADLILFDLYAGGQIPQGKKGLSFRLVFRSLERTLDDAEVNGIIEEVLDHLRKELKIALR
jgi:phenylalanyl-tRNA synthetase beta chain